MFPRFFPAVQRTALILLFAGLLALSAPAHAEDFACGDPPFGVSINELNQNDFVKFTTKYGVAYYNYTGHCKLSEHERGAASVVFAFVGDKLFARIVRTREDDLNELTRKANIMFGSPKIHEEKDKYVLIWPPKQDIQFKVNYNKRTHESESMLYYVPIKKELGVD